MLQYFACTLLLRSLQVLKTLQIKLHNNWTYWFMGVALFGCGYNKWSHHWCQTWETCLCNSNGRFCSLMRVKVVHISLDCSVLLAGKLWRGHGGNSEGKHE